MMEIIKNAGVSMDDPKKKKSAHFYVRKGERICYIADRYFCYNLNLVSI